MHKSIIPVVVLALVVVIATPGPPALAAPPTASSVPSITLLNPPSQGEIHIRVGESYTLRWHVASDAPFQSVAVLADQYYPGRGINFHGSDRAGRGTSADVSLTLTGKEPTSSLGDGYAPISPVVVVRFGQGVQPYTQTFNLKVYVTS